MSGLSSAYHIVNIFWHTSKKTRKQNANLIIYFQTSESIAEEEELPDIPDITSDEKALQRLKSSDSLTSSVTSVGRSSDPKLATTGKTEFLALLDSVSRGHGNSRNYLWT